MLTCAPYTGYSRYSFSPSPSTYQKSIRLFSYNALDIFCPIMGSFGTSGLTGASVPSLLWLSPPGSGSTARHIDIENNKRTPTLLKYQCFHNSKLKLDDQLKGRSWYDASPALICGRTRLTIQRLSRSQKRKHINKRSFSHANILTFMFDLPISFQRQAGITYYFNAQYFLFTEPKAKKCLRKHIVIKIYYQSIFYLSLSAWFKVFEDIHF